MSASKPSSSAANPEAARSLTAGCLRFLPGRKEMPCVISAGAVAGMLATIYITPPVLEPLPCPLSFLAWPCTHLSTSHPPC